MIRNLPRVARLESRLRLGLPWTRRAEMHRMITLVAAHHNITMAQAYALRRCARGPTRAGRRLEAGAACTE